MVKEQAIQQKASKLINRYSFTIFPDALNYAGTLFGGKLLAEMDLAASNSVRRLLYKSECDSLVTARLSAVDFINPAYLGDIIELNTKISALGRTSITVEVEANSENLEGSKQHICSASFIMVALKDRKPFPHFQKM